MGKWDFEDVSFDVSKILNKFEDVPSPKELLNKLPDFEDVPGPLGILFKKGK